MNLLGRVSLLLGTALLLFGVLLGQMISRYYERTELNHEKDHLARYIREQALHRHLSPDDFAVPKTGESYERFREKLTEIRSFGDVLLIVVFSPEGTVAWSDFRERVGTRSSSRKLQKALRGEIVAVLSTPERERDSIPGSPEEILDLYVPIPGNTAGSVLGVVEIYRSADGLRASVRTAVRTLWAVLGGGFSLLFLVLFGIVRQGQRVILSGQEELRAFREKIRSQNMELLRLVGASVRGEREIDKVLAQVTKEVRRLLDLPRCAIRIFGDPDTVVEERSAGVPSSASALPGSPRPGDAEEILRKGRTLILQDGAESPGSRGRKESGGPSGPGACLGIPLITPEGIMGALFLEQAAPHRWTPEEVETAEAVAGQVAMAVRQARMSREQEDLSGRLLALMNNVPGLVYRGYPDWSIGVMGGDAERITGYSSEEFTSGPLNWRELILPEDLEKLETAMREAIHGKEKSLRLEYRAHRRDGSVGWLEDRRQLVYDDAGRFLYLDGLALDITERLRSREESERLQVQLVQSQKMEALGILAGGVAHDFNNLLTGILGYADLLDREAAAGSRTAEAARVIRESAERASRLTSQLLGFARKGKNMAVPVDLRKTAGDVVKILERTLDRRIRILTRYPDDAATVLGDPTQLSQVAMNLGLNGRDAMPEGGELTLSIERRELDPEFCRANRGAIPGRYVVFSVRDTGVGIPEKDLPRIFEPFFSTKEQGKGSGLGLSMVFGIVKNHGGYITVHSREAAGTTVTVYLPAHEGEAAADSPDAPSPIPRPGKKGVVLLVDDEETVREVCTSMLDVLGYEVIPATNGREGVDLYRDRWREIDLVILDMIMPKMGGRDCFREIRGINPAVRAILATGYSLDGAVQEILGEGMEGFLQKPFRLDQLAGAVSHAMQRLS